MHPGREGGGRRGKTESRKTKEGNKGQKEKEESKRRGGRRGERLLVHKHHSCGLKG